MSYRRLAQNALNQVKGSLVLDFDVERFLANERLPFAAPARSGIELSWRDFFEALPRCHEQGDMRYLNPKTSSGGLPNEEVAAELEKLGGLTPETFERYFHENPRRPRGRFLLPAGDRRLSVHPGLQDRSLPPGELRRMKREEA